MNTSKVPVGTKKCGWVCHLLKDINDFTDKIPVIGKLVGPYLTGLRELESFIANGYGRMGENTLTINYEPTPAETAILDRWAEATIMPFSKALYTQFAAAFNNTGFSAQLAQFNEILLKMAVVEKYYLTNQTTGLSKSALTVRQQLIGDIFKPIKDLIAKAMATQPTVRLVNASYTSSALNTNLFKPGIATPPNGVIYGIMKYDTASAPAGTVIPPVKIPTVPTTPVQTIDQGGIAEDIKTASSKITVTQIVFGVGLLYAAWELLKGKKKKKNEN